MVEASPSAASVSVHLPDGSTRQLPVGATAADLAGAMDGVPVDLRTPLPDGATVSVVTADSPEGRTVLRHSTAHVLAQAVCDLWPGAKYAIGPPVEDGFYYDFELPGGAHFSDDDLERIEARMREIVKADEPFVREEVDRDAGLALFTDQPYKLDIIERVDSSEVGE